MRGELLEVALHDRLVAARPADAALELVADDGAGRSVLLRREIAVGGVPGGRGVALSAAPRIASAGGSDEAQQDGSLHLSSKVWRRVEQGQCQRRGSCDGVLPVLVSRLRSRGAMVARRA